MIMRWRNVQTNEYDLQAKTYSTIYTHHKLHNANENKFPFFPECIYNKLVQRPLVARCLILQLGAVIWLEDRVLG